MDCSWVRNLASRVPRRSVGSPSTESRPATIVDPDLSATAEFWDATASTYFEAGGNSNRAEWQGHPLSQARRMRVQGGLALSEWVAARLPKGAESALGVGCGQASLELDLLAAGAVKHFDLYDVSAVSLDFARQRAVELGLGDRVSINCQDMSSVAGDNYDLITFVSSLHHATNVADAVNRSKGMLKPGGLLIADEYIGPSRFGFPADHLRLPRTLYRCLSDDIRAPFAELPLPDPVEVERADPTEAVQSDEIVQTLRAVFDHVEVTPLFGALPFMLWWGLNHNALWETAKGMEFVQMVLELDQALYESGTLPSYFALLVAHDD